MKILEHSVNCNQKVIFYIDDVINQDTLKINLKNYDRAIIFCDLNVKNLLFNFKKKIKNKIFIKKIFYLKPNEVTKSLKELPKILNNLENSKITKSDLVIAVGGGSITDAVSFASSIYMRGIDLFLVPTTLMGQADATTAGKTCINSTYTKNIIGTYYLPKFVYSNVCYLKQLPLFEHRQGISEIFKYGLLGSRKLIKLLEEYIVSYDHKLLVNILTNTIKVRISLRKKNGLISNLGHTFGHALEKTSKYKVAHGDAISVGILLALKFSLEKKIISLKFYNEIKNLMFKLKINTYIDTKFKIDQILNVMMMDKKSKYNLIGLVLIKDIAKIFSSSSKPFFYIKKSEMKKFLTKNLKNFSKKNHWLKLKKNEI